ncbi:MAG: histidine--tRNA ligase [Chitinispirillaceae bacterium]|nr:histidine--tRNA ligase [Chitinispirillaceae bacterium]
MEIPSGPKGTRDFYPDLMAFQEYLFASWRRSCSRYAFEAWEAPMFEQVDIYTQKSGAEIEKQLYTFKDKGGRMMALRPEMTPSLARMVAAKGTSLKRPVRWYSIARLFRYEKMQRGRLREFFQLNMDILGTGEVSADAELIAAVIDMMRDLGLTDNDFQVRISSRTLLEECFCAFGLSKECFAPLYALLDRKNKIAYEEYLAELAEIITDGQLRQRINDLFNAQSLAEIAALTGATPEHAVLARLFSLLENYGMSDYACFDINIVRGLAYYTGIVFEVFAVNKGMRAIAGGGRYDNLVELYGGPPTPAVGFAAGDVVLRDLLQERGLIPPSSPRCSVFITALDDESFNGVVTVTRLLRSAGISCAFPFKRVAIGRQLKQADAAGAVITLITGGDESLQGLIKMKRMSDGKEVTVPREKLLERIVSMIDRR